MIWHARFAAIAAVLFAAPAWAGGVSITVSDSHGTPIADAVVALISDSQMALPESRVPASAIIDQRHEMFIPLVSLIRKGGHVTFTNNDTTMHQVYSFSVIRQFQFEIDQGQHSKPVIFDEAGIAPIGCNIHDQMITYVYVASSPFTALTDAKGHAQFSDVPDGAYHAIAWHPQLAPGTPTPTRPVMTSSANVAVTMEIPLLAGPKPGTAHMHMGGY